MYINNTAGFRYGIQPVRAVVSVRKEKKYNMAPQTDFLIHYGISGQHWGIRRFQNEDGSLTEEGKERYSKPESETWKKSDAEHLSDEELRRRNNRLNAERQYRDLTTSEVEKERKQRTKDIINKVLVASAITLIGAVVRAKYKQAGSFISRFAKKKFATYKAAGMIKSTLNKANVPFGETYNPLKTAMAKKHPSWVGLDKIRVGL